MVGAWTGDQHSAVSIRGLMAKCRVLTADGNIQLRIPQLFGSGSAGLVRLDEIPAARVLDVSL